MQRESRRVRYAPAPGLQRLLRLTRGKAKLGVKVLCGYRKPVDALPESRLNTRHPKAAAAMPRNCETAVFWAIAVAASAQFALGYVFALKKPFDPVAFAYGQVDFPYRRRLLMQWGARAALRLTHAGVYHLGTRTVNCLEAFLLLAMFFSMLLAIATARDWILILIPQPSARPWLPWTALSVVWMANYHFLLVPENRIQAPYDVPSMALFGLGLYAAFSVRRALFYAVLIVGTLNRETTLFLPAAFLLLQLPPAPSLWRALGRASPLVWAECVAGVAVWAMLVRWCDRLSGGPGGLVLQFGHNLRLLANPAHWPTYLSLFGFLWVPWLLFLRRMQNVRLQRLAWLLPPWGAVMLLFGDMLEIRIWSEWIVYFAVCMAALLLSHVAVLPLQTSRYAEQRLP